MRLGHRFMHRIYIGVLFSSFHMTLLVVQESIILSECTTLHHYDNLASNVVLSMFFKTMDYFSVKCLLVYTMKVLTI